MRGYTPTPSDISRENSQKQRFMIVYAHIDDALLAKPAEVGHALLVHGLAGGLRLD